MTIFHIMNLLTIAFKRNAKAAKAQNSDKCKYQSAAYIGTRIKGGHLKFFKKKFQFGKCKS